MARNQEAQSVNIVARHKFFGALNLGVTSVVKKRIFRFWASIFYLKI